MTTSNSIALRPPLFFVPTLPYNARKIAALAGSTPGRGGGKITMGEFAERVVEAPGSSAGDRGK